MRWSSSRWLPLTRLSLAAERLSWLRTPRVHEVIAFMSESTPSSGALLLRHQDEAPKERSACGYRYRLLSRGDENVAAWAHAVDIDGAKPHYHKLATELYYVLDGEGFVILDGEEREVRTGTMVHIPPGVVHSAVGQMRVLVVGIPDIDDSDVYYLEGSECSGSESGNHQDSAN